ncbi:MAG: prolyl oligopeptidase family protein [Fimbriimonadales bacterium]
MKSFLILASLCVAGTCAAQLRPPVAARGTTKDTYHGVEVSDPYRWLENQTSPETRKWIDGQNRYSDALLKNQPSRPYLKRKLTQMIKIEHVEEPAQRNNRFFFSKQRAQDEQAILYYRDGLDGKDQVLIDPNPMSKDHTITAGLVDFSDDGRYVAYDIRQGGADETVVHIRDLQTGKDLPDTLPLANYWSYSLVGDMSGIYYCPHVNLVGVRVKYHKMGTPVSADKEIFGAGYNAEIGLGMLLSENNRWLVITVSKGWDKTDIYVKDIKADGPITPVVTGFGALYNPFVADDTLYLVTDKDAPKKHIIAYDLTNLGAGPHEVVPAGSDSIDSATVAGGRLFVARLHNVSSQITAYEPNGTKLGEVPLPGIGNALLPAGRWKSNTAFFTFDSFTTPQQIYSLDVSANKSELWHETKIPGIDTSKLTTVQKWFKSKDGTPVPMFLVYKKGLKLDGNRPTLLYGYGGFDVNQLPYFSGSAVLLAENGGVFALVNLRGGGEFGEAWHQAGMLGKKQNVFDDFIGAAEWLEKNGITKPSKLAIRGGSNGGLLMGAALTQRPDLFQAVLCEVPLLDMLRYDLFLQGPQWVPEYGSARNPEQFKWLYAYSPYQHVQKGVQYPAVVFDTGDSDTRVAPLHARKMTALLQWATGSLRPILLHYETTSGHSGGESMTKEIDHGSLLLAFLFWQLGIRPK